MRTLAKRTNYTPEKSCLVGRRYRGHPWLLILLMLILSAGVAWRRYVAIWISASVILAGIFGFAIIHEIRRFLRR